MNDIKFTLNEQLIKLQELNKINSSRSKSLAITKLEECLMWLDNDNK
jgi:hypothetical protein